MIRFPAPGGGEEASAQSAQYGKALSGYIRLLTKEYRNASPDRKTELRKQADEAIRLVFTHLPGKDFRAHQHICDFYAETGDYDTAMKHLALSIAEDGEGNTFESRAAAVLEKCGRLGELVKLAYLRYVSMMHRCFRSGDPHGETMLRLILAGPMGMDDLKHLLGNPYPDAVILWHLAGSLAQLPEEGKAAQSLFDCAVRALMNRGELFRTISMAVRAEKRFPKTRCRGRNGRIITFRNHSRSIFRRSDTVLFLRFRKIFRRPTRLLSCISWQIGLYIDGF